jgi:hypothetical protein
MSFIVINYNNNTIFNSWQVDHQSWLFQEGRDTGLSHRSVWLAKFLIWPVKFVWSSHNDQPHFGSGNEIAFCVVVDLLNIINM